MIAINEGNMDDVERVNDFYESQQRGRPAQVGDILLLAEDDGVVVGAVRLCHEEQHMVLRGMHIDVKYRGQGIGSRMLRLSEEHIGRHDCYCLPWAHLVRFYQTIGFERIEGAAVPKFLAERMHAYNTKADNAEYQRVMQADLRVSPPGGLRFVCMRREVE